MSLRWGIQSVGDVAVMYVMGSTVAGGVGFPFWQQRHRRDRMDSFEAAHSMMLGSFAGFTSIVWVPIMLTASAVTSVSYKLK